MNVNIAYVRVSRAEENVENQMQAIRRFVGEDKEIKFFTDVGVSGVVPAKKRKGFSEMLKFIHEVRQQNKETEINLYVYEISRIGRDMFDTVMMINKFEKELNVRVISVSEKEQFLNTQEPAIRNLILTILAWVAERERELIRQRSIEGMRRAIAEGKHIGRPRIELSQKQIRKIKQYLKLGLPLTAIAKLVGLRYNTLYSKVIELGLYESKRKNRKEENVMNEKCEEQSEE